MHTFPIVLVSADNPEDALAEADSFVDGLLEQSDGLFSYGGVADSAAAVEAGRPEYAALVEGALEAEARARQEHWDALRTAMRYLADRETLPDDAEQVPVAYRVGTGITGILKAGDMIKGETSFGQVLYRAHKLYVLRNHLSDRTGNHPGVDAYLYDARDDTSAPPAEVSSGVYAVLLDLHY